MVGLWGFAPSEFWRMTLREFWCIYDAKIGGPKYGSLTEDDVESLAAAIRAAEAREAA